MTSFYFEEGCKVADGFKLFGECLEVCFRSECLIVVEQKDDTIVSTVFCDCPLQIEAFINRRVHQNCSFAYFLRGGRKTVCKMH
jgi:hypothetical protein